MSLARSRRPKQAQSPGLLGDTAQLGSLGSNSDQVMQLDNANQGIDLLGGVGDFLGGLMGGDSEQAPETEQGPDWLDGIGDFFGGLLAGDEQQEGTGGQDSPDWFAGIGDFFGGVFGAPEEQGTEVMMEANGMGAQDIPTAYGSAASSDYDKKLGAKAEARLKSLLDKLDKHYGSKGGNVVANFGKAESVLHAIQGMYSWNSLQPSDRIRAFKAFFDCLSTLCPLPGISQFMKAQSKFIDAAADAVEKIYKKVRLNNRDSLQAIGAQRTNNALDSATPPAELVRALDGPLTADGVIGRATIAWVMDNQAILEALCGRSLGLRHAGKNKDARIRVVTAYLNHPTNRTAIKRSIVHMTMKDPNNW